MNSKEITNFNKDFAIIDKYIKKVSKWVNCVPSDIVIIKIRPLSLDENFKKHQFLIPKSYFDHLFAEWTSTTKAKIIGNKPRRVHVRTVWDNIDPNVELKTFVVEYENGPEIILNTKERKHIEENFAEIVEYISELIETIAKQKPAPDAYSIELRSIKWNLIAGVVSKDEIKTYLDDKVRVILKPLIGFGPPRSHAKPPLHEDILPSKTGREFDMKKMMEHTEEFPDEAVPQNPISLKEAQYDIQQVFYATCRKRIKNANWNNFYGSERGELETGICNVNIPKNHERGELERPGWFRDLFFGESQEKHVMLVDVVQKEEKDFLELIKKKVGSSTASDALIFIHGFNVDWAESMRRTAQLQKDLAFDGAVFGFSWPSKGNTLDYITDLEGAFYSVQHLKNFVLKLSSLTMIKKLHIIAHSMGNSILAEALKELSDENKYPIPFINQIILAAPDIDKGIFEKQIAPKIIKSNTPRFTLYASSKDKALLASQKIRSDYPRLGQGGDNLFLLDGIDSIDASKVDTDLLAHGYFAETKELLDDIHLVLGNKVPDERHLKKKARMALTKSITYWVL